MSSNSRDQFTQWYGLVKLIVREDIGRRLGVSAAAEMDEIVTYGLGEAWLIYQGLDESRGPVVERIKLSARMAARRATTEWVRERRRQQRAMEAARVVAREREHYVPVGVGARDVSDRTQVEAIIDLLPPGRLQETARLASHGLSQAEVIARVRESRSTVQRSYAAIRDVLSGLR